MKSIKVNLKSRSYSILIGSGILKDFAKYAACSIPYRKAFVVTNACIYKKFGKTLELSLKRWGFLVKFNLVPDTEKSKSFVTATKLVNGLALFDKEQRAFVIALGGGVIGDLSGFIAAIYKRGIPYVQIPTTLLAQVDSAIGGKTAIDLEYGKNLVGAIYQPKLVFSDTRALKSLTPRQLRSGLAEVIKYAIIKDPKLFRYLENNLEEILKLKNGCLEFIVNRCSRIKARIVSLDEKEEKGIRTILNFGHTIGHAIEAANKFSGYSHGEAISLGMLVAADISSCLKLSENKTTQRMENLIQGFGLPVEIKNTSLKEIISCHYLDKKFFANRNRFVLIKDIGKTQIADNIPLELIKKSIEKRIR